MVFSNEYYSLQLLQFEASVGSHLWDLAVSMHPEDLKRITRTLIGRAPDINESKKTKFLSE